MGRFLFACSSSRMRERSDSTRTDRESQRWSPSRTETLRTLGLTSLKSLSRPSRPLSFTFLVSSLLSLAPFLSTPFFRFPFCWFISFLLKHSPLTPISLLIPSPPPLPFFFLLLFFRQEVVVVPDPYAPFDSWSRKRCDIRSKLGY